MAFNENKKMSIPPTKMEGHLVEKRMSCFKNMSIEKQNKLIDDVLEGRRINKTYTRNSTLRSTTSIHIFSLKDLLDYAQTFDKSNSAKDELGKILKWLKSHKLTPTFDKIADKFNLTKHKLLKLFEKFIIKSRSLIGGFLDVFKNNRILIFKQISKISEKVKSIVNSKILKQFIVKVGKPFLNKVANSIGFVIHIGRAIDDLINNDKKTFKRVMVELSANMIKSILEIGLMIVTGWALGTALLVGGPAGLAIAIVVVAVIHACLAYYDKQITEFFYDALEKTTDTISVGLDHLLDFYIDLYKSWEKMENKMFKTVFPYHPLLSEK